MAIIHGKTGRGEPFITFTGKDFKDWQPWFTSVANAIKEEMALSQELSDQRKPIRSAIMTDLAESILLSSPELSE